MRGSKLFAAAALVVGVWGAAEAAPPFWGSSYARVAGPGETVLGSGHGPIAVSALLPPGLECSRLLRIEVQPPPQGAQRTDPFAAARVTLFVEPAPCTGWGDFWLRFVVSGTGTADILDLVYVGPGGGFLAGERVAVETSTDG